jgi:hypothetical protein
VNAYANNNYVWIGDGGYFEITFTNNNGNQIILIFWAGDNSGFVNAHQPLITYSLAAGASVRVGVADGVGKGGFSAVYPDTPTGSYGQVNNTWGEFTAAGQYSTFDISREVNMHGHDMKIESKTTSCVADMVTCAFLCNQGDNCYVAGSYHLLNCQNGINNNYYLDQATGAVSGGCQIGDGGEIDVTFF